MSLRLIRRARGSPWSLRLVIDDLIHGSVVTNDPARLLAADTLVWLGNNLSFSLLYWPIDSGSVLPQADRPAARSGTPFDVRRG